MRSLVGGPAPAACLAALLAACVPHTPASSPAVRDHTWQITGHRLPGVSAMTADEAERWHGRFVHLQAHRASNARQTCDAPSYSESTHAASRYLIEQYRLQPQALGVPPDAEVHVIEVTCQGQPWAALGGRILSFGAAGDFTVWDGVFFALRRVHL